MQILEYKMCKFDETQTLINTVSHKTFVCGYLLQLYNALQPLLAIGSCI